MKHKNLTTFKHILFCTALAMMISIVLLPNTASANNVKVDTDGRIYLEDIKINSDGRIYIDTDEFSDNHETDESGRTYSNNIRIDGDGYLYFSHSDDKADSEHESEHEDCLDKDYLDNIAFCIVGVMIGMLICFLICAICWS